MTDGHLSHEREHLADLQRKRRASLRRVDYMPSPDALGVIEARRAIELRGSVAATNSAVLNSIVLEWALLTGINNQRTHRPKSSASASGIMGPVRADAYEFGGEPEFPLASRTRAGAYESGAASPARGEVWLAENKAKQVSRRIICGAKRHRDGQPCQALSEPGKRRCRFHGGRSTGPRTLPGKTRALANLRQNRKSTESGQ